MLNKLLVVASFIGSASLSFATSIDYAKFTDLDDQFAVRDTLSETEIVALIGSYDKLIATGLTGDDLFYAVHQANKLEHYYGDDVLAKTGKDADKRQVFFERCINRTEATIAPAKLTGDFATKATYLNQYYYWKMSCMALTAEVSNLIKRADLALKLKKLKDNELGISAKRNADGSVTVTTKNDMLGNLCFDGGGVMRTLAGVMSSPLAAAFGLYDRDQAYAYADATLATQKNDDQYCFAAGNKFLNNYHYKASALKEMGKKDAAKAVLIGVLKDYIKLGADGEFATPIDRDALVDALAAAAEASASSSNPDGLYEMLPEASHHIGTLATLYEELK